MRTERSRRHPKNQEFCFTECYDVVVVAIKELGSGYENIRLTEFAYLVDASRLARVKNENILDSGFADKTVLASGRIGNQLIVAGSDR